MKFYVGDFNAIEARCIAWLADETELLDLFQQGADPYCDMASKIYGYPVTKDMKKERFDGKSAILGCGYQMGASKYSMTYNVPMELAEAAVGTYRGTYKRIVNMWKYQEMAAIKAVKTGAAYSRNYVTWEVDGDFLVCTLPSGRPMVYHHPELVEKETPWGEMKEGLTYMALNSMTKQYTAEQTYGGKLVENITQAVARDLMAEAMLRLEDNGYTIIMTVHDEAVAEVPDDFGSVEEFEKLMEQTPKWADGLPVVVEAWEGKRYRK